MIALHDTGTHPCLRRQLKRGLKEVHEEPGYGIEPTESFSGCETFQPTVTDEFSNNRAILLLDPRLIIFPIRTRARELDPLLFAVDDHRLVHELTSVVDIESQQRVVICHPEPGTYPPELYVTHVVILRVVPGISRYEQSRFRTRTSGRNRLLRV